MIKSNGEERQEQQVQKTKTTIHLFPNSFNHSMLQPNKSKNMKQKPIQTFSFHIHFPNDIPDHRPANDV